MFKKCPMCKTIWETRNKFLNDETLKLVGYQKYMGLYGGGYLLFKHKAKSCGTTLAIKATSFSSGAMSTQRLKRIYKKNTK